MYVQADQFNVVKNKWKNQQIHKIHNEIQYASKHYFNVNYDNDIIFTPKAPQNQRKHHKRHENLIERQRINKTLTFDYYDFMFQNKNENFKRIHIRPTIYYNQTRDHIDEIIDHFYDQKHSDIFTYIPTNNYKPKPKPKKPDTKTKTKKSDPNNLRSFTEYQRQVDPEKCYKCGTTYNDLNTKHCLYCTNSTWLLSLFEGNKVDIFDNKYNNWYIGTIIKVNKSTNNDCIQLDFLIHYDGFNPKFDEWINFNLARKYSIITLNKIQKLHMITSCHAYELMNKLKPCVARPYTQCILCDMKYCIHCMKDKIEYKKCNECLRLINNNKWIQRLQIGDKLDVYLYGYKGNIYNCKWYSGWQIGTVIQIKKDFDLKHKLKLFIHFDGLETIYDRWIDINCWEKLVRNKIKKLNKITLFHSYLLDRKQNECAEINCWEKCVCCKRKCCLKCVEYGIIIDGIGYKCNECGIKNEKKELLNVIKQSLYGKYNIYGPIIQMNVIYNIYEYSMGITVNCCNQIKNCINEINFNTIYEMELNAQTDLNEIYQYYVPKNQNKCIFPNVTICNKMRRIFCKDCTKNELMICILCKKTKELKATKSKWYIDQFKCAKCLNEIVKEKQLQKQKKLELKSEIKNKIKKKEENNSFVDIHFKNFKDNIYSEIKLRKLRTKQNIKIINKIFAKHNVNIEDLPYNIWSEECNLNVGGKKCWRKYCAFYHCNEEKQIGKILSMIREKVKFEKRIFRDKSYLYIKGFNEELMDCKFNLDYVYNKQRKSRSSKFGRKSNVKRRTKKRMKRKAYYLRKADKKSKVKQIKKYKKQYCFDILKELY